MKKPSIVLTPARGMKRFRVSVEKKHISAAICENENHCMISDAVQEKFPDAKYVRADGRRLILSRGDIRYTYTMPVDGAIRLLAFDCGCRAQLKPVRLTFEDPRCHAVDRSNHGRPGRLTGKYKKNYPKKTRVFGLRSSGKKFASELLDIENKAKGYIASALRMKK